MFIRQLVSVSQETKERLLFYNTFKVNVLLANKALDGKNEYELLFEPRDFKSLIIHRIILKADFTHARKYGSIQYIATSPVDLNGRITFYAVTKDKKGNLSSVPLREDDPRYGMPLQKPDFLEYVRTHQEWPDKRDKCLECGL